MIEPAQTSTAAPLTFELLGPLQLMRSGDRVPLGGRQQRAVLALLLVEANTVVSLDRLIDALWGERVPNGAATTIQTYVSHLRDLFQLDRRRGATGGLLSTEAGGYRLRVEAADIDAAVFEQRVHTGQVLLAAGRFAEASIELDAALGLWRGPVLADLAGYDFVQISATRLEELRLDAIQARIEADLALGRHQNLVGELDQLTAQHPLREQLHAHRMLALYRSGRQSDALAGYQRLRATLATELGIDPSPPLQRLHRAILIQDPDLNLRLPAAPDRDQPAAAAEPTAAGRAGAVTTPPLPSPPQDDARAPRHRRRRWLLFTAVPAAAALIAGVAVIVAAHSPRPGLSVLPANSIGSFDTNGALRSAVAVGQSPDGLAYGDGALWVANTGTGTVSRINPATRAVVQTIPVGSAPNAITVTGDDVWVANGGDGTVSRINALTDGTVDTIRVGNLPDAIDAGPSGVWVAVSGDDTVRRIDPTSGRPDLPISVGGQPDGIGVGPHTVWVANGQDGTVTRIDAATGDVASPIFVGAGPKGVAITPTAVWITNALEPTVSRIDPVTGGVTATIVVGDGPHSVVARPDTVWVSDEYDGTIAKIDPKTGRDLARILTGSSPRGLAMVGSTLWVASGASANPGHTGGTLTVETGAASLPGVAGIEPAEVYDPATFSAEHLVYDGLVELRRAPGANGFTLVPDLAINLPRPTDSGRTYTFTVRSGIRYSTGQLVRAADLGRGVRRALASPDGNPGYYLGIIGARNCIDHPTSCDLSHGVVTDDATSSVIFHLTAPDPDFLYKLTVFVYATAPGALTGLAGAPLPATGPYMISGYAKQAKQFTLVRNPHFHQWSFAAQPAGYPDAIRWKLVPNGSTRLADVLAGHADLMDLGSSGLTSDVVEDLLRRYPARLHTNSAPAHNYEFLNTRVAPFNDIRVRKALNDAVDRRRLVALVGGTTQAEPNCQLDPPNIPGYRPYCPYTLDPQPDGSYHGPDLATANALITASGTRGMPVTVWSLDLPYVPAISEYYITVLRTLGYRVTQHEAQLCCYYSQAGDSRNRAQIGFGFWGVDFPAPSNFYAPVLSCRVYAPATANNPNLSEYCNRQADNLAAQALADEDLDPAAARRLWAQVDRIVTDNAPWVSGTAVIQSELTSTRLGNYQDNPLLGPLLDQAWVR